jgi:predicted metal-dependent phosphoesterase TrpH
MVATAVRLGIEVVAVTDHFRVSSSASLINAFEQAGIIVFPSFEANRAKVLTSFASFLRECL